MRSCAYAAIAAWLGCGTPTVADTVALGDNPEAVEIVLDEDFFHCVIQPEVVTAYRCAAGAAEDGGGCHAARSALRLVEVDGAPRCSEGRVLGVPPDGSVFNLERIRATISGDAEASPFYRRPVGIDSHPRVIFEEDAPAAQRIRDWLDRGAP